MPTRHAQHVLRQLARGYYLVPISRLPILIHIFHSLDVQKRAVACFERAKEMYEFLYHPLYYQSRLPFYSLVVAELSFLEKVIYKFEVLKTDTFLQDFYYMFQNFIDYSLLVNPSNGTMKLNRVQALYDDH